MLGRDVNARPTAQQVNQLVYIGQILKESLRLWPTAPAFGLYPYQHETIGGKYKLRKRTFVTVLTAMLHRDKSVWGPQRRGVQPRQFRARARGQDGAARLQAVRQRPARLHRPAVRHDRGDAGAGPDPAALPAGRSHALPAQDQGIAHHQARRAGHARAAAARRGARLGRGRRRQAGATQGRAEEEGGEPWHQAHRAVRLQHGHRRGAGAADRRGRRGAGLRHDVGQPRRPGGQALGRGRGGDRLRLLQRRAARQCRRLHQEPARGCSPDR